MKIVQSGTKHNMRVRQHVREQILPGAAPVPGISIGSFVRGAALWKPYRGDGTFVIRNRWG